MGERMIAMSTTLNLASIKPSLDKLRAIECELAASLIERDEVIRASLVALLARQRLVVLGPPGTGKSALVTELAQRISPQNGGGLRSFAYLMTRFTTPEELFGPVSVSWLKRDEYRRITAGKLVEAELVFLDEIFKASSAILNALLKIANERAFHNGGQEIQIPLISLFGASNEMPQGNELEALWDRFLLRFRVGYVTDTGFIRFIRAAPQNLARIITATTRMAASRRRSRPTPNSSRSVRGYRNCANRLFSRGTIQTESIR
jgi:MoxR-like ATPase